MTDPQTVIAQALELCEQEARILEASPEQPYMFALISKPLAALIRQAAEPAYVQEATGERWKYLNVEECRICHTRRKLHAPDCALLALCDAINGEGGG